MLLLRSANKLTQLHSQGACQGMGNFNPDADFAQFNRANVRPMDVRPLRKILLRQAQALPLATDGCSEGEA
jgi:hypothetical protein